MVLVNESMGVPFKVYLKAVLLPQNGAVDRSDDGAGVCTQI